MLLKHTSGLFRCSREMLLINRSFLFEVVVEMLCTCIILGILLVAESIVILWLFFSHKKKTNIDGAIQFFRDLWWKFVCYVLATSVIGLFLGSIFFKEVIGLNEINTWVGIVLGLVALVIGVISLFLSFYNVDQANKTQEKTVDIIQKFQDKMVDRMHKLQVDVEHKIDESTEKTRSDLKFYNSTSETSVNQETGNSVKWEDL